MTNEADELRSEIANLPGPKNCRRYPEGLRARIVAYAQSRMAEGASTGRVAGELGMGEPTVGRFVGARRKRRRGRSVGFASLRVVEPAQAPAASAGRVVVRAPGGVVVEGLSVEELGRLLRELSCSA